MDRSLVFVSGYYGFDNLGDEAILEEICNELKTLVKAQDIVILSAKPELTETRFGVRAIKRNDFLNLFGMLSQARLFISGGGGLFQNTKTLGSIFFYGLQLLMAKANNAKTLIYAQGIGPLRGRLAENICKEIFSQVDEICVRDDASVSVLAAWGLSATRTADPVWMLQETEADPGILAELDALGASKENSRCIGISLRPSPELQSSHLQNLLDGLESCLDKQDSVLLLPLQLEQDRPLLETFAAMLAKTGRKHLILDSNKLERPSQWLSIFSRLKCLVGMRLHALLMTLKSGKPVIGIAYDPKVTQLLTDFEQRCLILTKEGGGNEWPNQLKTALEAADHYTKLAQERSESVKNLSCQNFKVLARILSMPRELEELG